MLRLISRKRLLSLGLLFTLTLLISCTDQQETSPDLPSHPDTHSKDTLKGSNMGNEVPVPDQVNSSENGSASEKVLYVLASSGLNLRKTSDPASEVLTNIPYGGAVTSQSLSENGTLMTVENMAGKMVQVHYEDQSGFAFSGFLSPIPPPEGTPEDKYQYISDYVADLQKRGFKANLVEAKTEDSRLSLELPLVDFNAGYLIMKKLFFIPNTYILPKPGETITYSTPESPGQAALDGPYDYVTQSVTYQGSPGSYEKKIVYFDDNEVGGREITITAWAKNEGDGVSGVRMNLRNWAH